MFDRWRDYYMLKIDILTLFPHMFDGFMSESIIKRAIDKGKVEIQVHNIRDYSKDPHKKVEDYAFGGGSGMVLMPQPIFDAVEAVKTEQSKVILLTPQGKVYQQSDAQALALENHLIFICGHYEGFDERIRTLADLELSIGDYVLTGGELPAQVISDSVIRLLDGVITKESHEFDSFQEPLLDYPTYTKPQEFRGMKVPDVLLSGHHEKIREWRREQQLERTRKRRPDLLEKR